MKTKMKMTLVTLMAFGTLASASAMAQSKVTYTPAPSSQTTYQTYAYQFAGLVTSQKLDSYVSLIDAMRDHTTPMDWSMNFFPIKKEAAMAKIHLNANGPMSAKTIKALTKLITAIDTAGPRLDDLLQVQAYFDVATELLTIRETLAEQLD